MLRLGTRRVALDLLPDTLIWLSARDSASGTAIEAGERRSRPTQTAEIGKLLHGTAVMSQPRPQLDVVLPGHVPVQIQRLELSGVGRWEGQRVARRKLSALRADDPDGQLEVASLARVGGSGCIVWLFSAPARACHEIHAELRRAGLRPARLIPREFAIAALSSALSPLESGLDAFLWMEEELARCVVADREGWVFSRDIPLQPARSWPAETAGLEALPDAEPGMDLDWLATELERTCRYVEREVASESIRRLTLCGSPEGFPRLDQVLVQRLAIPVSTLGERSSSSPTLELRPLEAAAVGMCLLGRRVSEANLLPTRIRSVHDEQRARGRLVHALAVLAVCVALALGVGGIRYRNVATELDTAAHEFDSLSAERVAFAQAYEEAARIARLRELHTLLDRPEPPWGTLLDLLGRVAPEDLYVQRVEAWQDGTDWRLRLNVVIEAPYASESAARLEEYRARLLDLGLVQLEPLGMKPKFSDGEGTRGARGLRYQLEGRVAAMTHDGANTP